MRLTSPALAAAASGTLDFPAALHNGELTLVAFVPDASWTGQATNFRRFRLLNVTAGSIVVAQLDVTAGTQAIRTSVVVPTTPAGPGRPLPAVREGDILRWSSEAVGTGQADPGGLVVVIVSRFGTEGTY
jgi:hypothetical protein